MKEFVYYFFTAFEGAFILIFLSKGLMNGMIRRDANYYESQEEEEEMAMLRNADVKKKDDTSAPEIGGVQ